MADIRLLFLFAAASLLAADKPLSIAKQGYFYVGGHNGADAMFVEFQIPALVTAAYPIVLIHGQYQNGTNFLGTPDGRPGWRNIFCAVVTPFMWSINPCAGARPTTQRWMARLRWLPSIHWSSSSPRPKNTTAGRKPDCIRSGLERGFAATRRLNNFALHKTHRCLQTP